MTEPQKLFQHVEYLTKREEWRRARALLEGRRDELLEEWALWRHFFELNAANDPQARRQLESRMMRTRYLNLPEVVLSMWVSMLFAKSYTKTKVGEALFANGEDKSITGTGANLLAWIKQAAEFYLGYGRAPSLVDAPLEKKPETLAEQKASGYRATLELLHPLSVTDWSFTGADRRGKTELSFIRFEYEAMLPRARATEVPKIQMRSDEYYLDGVVQRLVWEGAVVDVTGGVVPVIPGAQSVDWKPTAPKAGDLKRLPAAMLIGDSWLHDVFEETLRFYNLRSSHDSILHNLGFSRTWIIGVDPRDEAVRKAITEYMTGMLPAGAQIQSIPPTPMDGHRTALEDSKTTVFNLGLNQLRMLPSDSRVGQSADSMAQQTDATRELLLATVQEIEDFTNQNLSFYAEYAGFADLNGPYITLNKDFDDQTLEMFAKVFGLVGADLMKYPQARKEILKKSGAKIGLSSDALKGIEDDERDPEPSIIRPNLANLQPQNADTVTAP